MNAHQAKPTLLVSFASKDTLFCHQQLIVYYCNLMQLFCFLEMYYSILDIIIITFRQRNAFGV